MTLEPVNPKQPSTSPSCVKTCTFEGLVQFELYVVHNAPEYFCSSYCTDILRCPRRTNTSINWLFFFIFKPHNRTITTYQVNVSIKLVVVYYNGEKPNLFRLHNDVTLYGLNDQLDQINGELKHIEKGGWTMFSIIDRWSTQVEALGSPIWSSRTKVMWEPCSLYLVGVVLWVQSS